MKRWNGSGLPFFVFLDSSGTVLVSSNEPAADGRKGGNIGYPSEPHEVDWFLAMLRKAIPQMSTDELSTIEKYLRPKKQ